MSVVNEQHYTLEEVAKMWCISYTTIWRRLRDEPGLLRSGRIIRVPRSKLESLYSALTAVPARVSPRRRHAVTA